jgi:glycosyltransferase involved in cell wall biosynthesis
MKFSVIVPTYNEEKDIRRTLLALEKLDWPDYEVIVVDDASRDKTKEIVSEFTSKFSNFHFLEQPRNRGVSFARNRGIAESSGEVMVILNADVILTSDFLKRIAPFYEQGNKWVGVVSRVLNLETIYPRFIETEGYYTYLVHGQHWVWSEGFSCTKDAAIEVGLFPEAMPGASGEDVDFGLDLEKKFKGVRAMDIIAPHIAPDNLKEFWHQQKGRGRGRTNYYYYMSHYGLGKLFMSSFISSVWRLIKLIPVPVVRAWQYSKYSTKKRADFIPFILVGWVKEVAMIVGIWEAYTRILKK